MARLSVAVGAACTSADGRAFRLETHVSDAGGWYPSDVCGRTPL